MPERTTIRLPEPLLAAAKKRAAEEGRTVTALIVEGLRKVLREAKPGKRVKLPPVCSASKRSKQPFPSPEAIKAAEEEADLDYVKRFMR